MRRTLTGCLILLLAACAPLTPPAVDESAVGLRWSQRRESLAAVLGFALQGRIAETHLGRSGELLWRQHADGRFELQLNGPFGVGAVAIEGDSKRVAVRTKDGTTYTDDPQDWMQTHLGWHLPLDSLRAWAMGLPAQGEFEHLSLDDEGRLLSLSQHGWTLRYDGYQKVGALELPRRLEAQSPTTRLRLVIDRWTAVDLATRM
ncbi:Outer membrane lipoprotein LolB [Fontimonas thermophila]|uniref:Outer-membrane lipoprotein LolB n=1 Tax=Fontimonas thermophila TaxID=1076937 RepID=A0A1I2IQP2_9GAMM|nr:lipoprotein insertase outer membrane protein LolB [Fontimonas thermophila]SFF43136.1 Outer membrane lipoprotein LolB [Fontimonas thermophila]